MENIKSLMLEFIVQHEGDPQTKTYPKIQQVLEIKMKENDDNYGAMGEHYVVKCKMLVYTNTGTTPSGGVFENVDATCLIDVAEFKKLSEEKQIAWRWE